jgi:hypothetical protein
VSDREAAIEGFLDLAARMKANPDIPAPAKTWPISFHAPPTVDTAEGLEKFAASLGVKGAPAREHVNEGTEWWAEAEGYVGGIAVRVTADTGARVLEPALFTAGDLHRVAMAVDVTGGVPA